MKIVRGEKRRRDGSGRALAEHEEGGGVHDPEVVVHEALLPDAAALGLLPEHLRAEERKHQLLEGDTDAHVIQHLALCLQGNLHHAEELHLIHEARVVHEGLGHLPHEGPHLAVRAARRRAVEQLPGAGELPARRPLRAAGLELGGGGLDLLLQRLGRVHAVGRRLRREPAQPALAPCDLARVRPEEGQPPRRPSTQHAALGQQTFQLALRVERGHATEAAVVAAP
mmetsp:Transcript_83532/g.244886  ORF Transcript_83532/g.244886 Transcript_83532/m.244886 type:complete len:226 (-) Transcript_83532:612-1289(-)